MKRAGGESPGRIAAVLQPDAGQVDANGSAGGEHEASCRMMLMLLSGKPIIVNPHRGAGKPFTEFIGCVSQGCYSSYDNWDQKLIIPICLLRPRSRIEGGWKSIPAEDDEAFLLSVAPSLPDLLLQDD
jgi:hypothetical protein